THYPTASEQEWQGDRLVFTCRDNDVVSHTELAFSVAPQHAGASARFLAGLEPQESWRLRLDITPSADVRTAQPTGGASPLLSPTEPLWQIPELQTADPALAAAYAQAIRDLHSLEMISGGHRSLAAGLPWFVALFGRDTLITAYQTMLLGPELA